MRRLVRWLVRAVLAVVGLVLLYVGASVAYVHVHEARTAAQAAPRGGHFTDVGGTAVFWQSHGDERRPALLLVHGTAAWSGTWFSLVPALQSAGYRVLAVDLPPFGYSAKAVGGNYTRAAQATRLRAVLDAAGVQRAIVVGHSFGGGPALELALQAPDRIERLVLVDAALGLQGPPNDPSSPACRVLGTRMLAEPLLASSTGVPLWGATLLRGFVARKDAVTPVRLREYRRPAAVQGANAGLAAWARHFACESETGVSTDPARVRGLAVPLDVIWGADDTITPLDQARHLQTLVPAARLQVIPGVGHIPHIEDPARFERVLLETLHTLPESADREP
jgi:pimeloyl-ACP methyl ester carboxylesterase